MLTYDRDFLSLAVPLTIRGATQRKGDGLLKSGHVSSVKEVKDLATGFSTVTAQVRPEKLVNNAPYTVKFNVSHLSSCACQATARAL